MRSQRAMRRLKPDPVPEELLLHLIDLAIRAPSGTNSQNWEFILVRDPELKARLGRQNRLAVKLYSRFSRPPVDERWARVVQAFHWQADHFHEIPVVMVACLRGRFWPFPFLAVTSFFGSIYPAVQNYLLAARAAGLGTTLITMPLWHVGKVRRILGLPGSLLPCCLVPTGYPYGNFGPTTRRPVHEVTHLDRYGNHPAGA